MDLRDHIRSYPFDSTFALDYGGKHVVARVDPHQWTYRNGQLITGLCIKGITLYEPVVAAAALVDATTAVDSLDTPDPNAAVFSESSTSPNWGLVAVSGIAVAGVVGLFLLALHAAPKPRPKPQWRHRIPRAY